MFSPTRKCLLAIAVMVSSWAASPAQSTEYVVNGFVLGRQVPFDSPVFRSYECEDAGFGRLTECTLTQSKQTSLGAGTLKSRILHTKDGTAVHLSSDLYPVALDEDTIRREINELSRELNQQPKKIEWSVPRPGVPRVAIVFWGEVELRRLSHEELRSWTDDVTPIWPGTFFDPYEGIQRSGKIDLPVYRTTGGPGYIYCASFNASGRGRRHYEAINVAEPLTRIFERSLTKILDDDRALSDTDYKFWPAVAKLTRRLALTTSPTVANKALDRVYEQTGRTKYRSHVWAMIPLGTLNNLADYLHGSDSVYREGTTLYPEIRRSIQNFLKTNPSEPYNDFLYYTVGEFDKAILFNRDTIIADVINYARGHELLETLLSGIPDKMKKPENDTRSEVNVDGGTVNTALVALNWYPNRYGNKPLRAVVPDFDSQAAAIRPYFEAVLRSKTSVHSDDAAYMLGWLAYHQGQSREALAYLAQALVAGNGDYKRPAMRQIVRILVQNPAAEQAETIASTPALSKEPAFWYLAARSAFRNFDFETAIRISERSLAALDIPLDRLPATTDPQKINDAINKLFPPAKEPEVEETEAQEGKKAEGVDEDEDENLETVFYSPKRVDDGFDYTNAMEIPYILEASREFLRYREFLNSVLGESPGNVEKIVKGIVVKYSLLLDVAQQPAYKPDSVVPVHKDLRQALHLIDVTLAALPASKFATLREWLHYRKVRILVQFDPTAVGAAVSQMAREFPNGDLVDDALAEQIVAEGVRMKNPVAAQRTLQRLADEFPKGNAVDNGYTWMAIVYRCMGRTSDARKINQQIITRFRASRHAILALERMAHPSAEDCGLSGFSR